MTDKSPKWLCECGHQNSLRPDPEVGDVLWCEFCGESVILMEGDKA